MRAFIYFLCCLLFNAFIAILIVILSNGIIGGFLFGSILGIILTLIELGIYPWGSYKGFVKDLKN